MLPLVVALTLSASSSPALPPLPDLPQGIVSQAQRCRDTDPRFVHYVAPPQGAGPLWAIGERNAGPVSREPSAPLALGCAPEDPGRSLSAGPISATGSAATLISYLSDMNV
jgi:hypothetical protein